MHIIFPVVVGSNAMEVLSGDLLGGYTHLMEFRSNERLRRAFPHHPVGTALLGRDIRSEFLPGARLDVHSHGTTIVCVGVCPNMASGIIQDFVSRLCEETPIDDIFLLSMFREIPGVDLLWDAFASSGVDEVEWSRFSAMLRGEPLIKTAQEPEGKADNETPMVPEQVPADKTDGEPIDEPQPIIVTTNDPDENGVEAKGSHE